MRTAQVPFYNHHRLVAHVEPTYTRNERKALTRRKRATFNLDPLESGHPAPFIAFPNIKGELDLPLFLELGSEARKQGRGQYDQELSLAGYECRMREKLHGITVKIAAGKELSVAQKTELAHFRNVPGNRNYWTSRARSTGIPGARQTVPARLPPAGRRGWLGKRKARSQVRQGDTESYRRGTYC